MVISCVFCCCVIHFRSLCLGTGMVSETPRDIFALSHIDSLTISLFALKEINTALTWLVFLLECKATFDRVPIGIS